MTTLGARMTIPASVRPPGSPAGILSAAAEPATAVLHDLDATMEGGLSGDQVTRRQAQYGPAGSSSRWPPRCW